MTCKNICGILVFVILAQRKGNDTLKGSDYILYKKNLSITSLYKREVCAKYDKSIQCGTFVLNCNYGVCGCRSLGIIALDVSSARVNILRGRYPCFS